MTDFPHAGFDDGAGAVGTYQDIYDNSTPPKTTTTAVKGPVQYQGGTGNDADTVLEVLNNAGSTTYSLSGAGDLIARNATMLGNVTVGGTKFAVDVRVSTSDNLIALNFGEIGAGVTNVRTGFIYDRGSLNSFFHGFDEANNNVRLGEFLHTIPYTGLTGAFIFNEEVTGGTSGATGFIITDDGSTMTLKVVVGTFTATETITGTDTLATATVASFTLNNDTQAIATREDMPNNTGIAHWDSSTNKFKTLPNVVIDDSGNVVIGATSSTQRLGILNADGGTVVISTVSAAPGGLTGIEFNFNSKLGDGTNNLSRIMSRVVSGGGGEILFQTAANSTAAYLTKAILKRDGNFLIGTETDTGEKLQINGAIKGDSYVGLPDNTLFVSIADATVVNTISETTLIGTGLGTETIPAAKLKIGAKYRITINGLISDTGNPNFQIRIKLDGTIIGDTGPNSLGAVTDDHWFLEFQFVIRTEGASGLVMASGAFFTEQGDHFGMTNTAAISINTTIDQIIAITAEWAVASPLNTVTAQILDIEELNV